MLINEHYETFSKQIISIFQLILVLLKRISNRRTLLITLWDFQRHCGQNKAFAIISRLAKSLGNSIWIKKHESNM